MLQTAMIFNDHMVLQRNKKIPVWGTAEAGSEVEVSFDGDTVTTTAGEDGSWKVELKEHEAGMNFTMKIRSKSEQIILTDICVGEVWIAGGQSNMEFWLGYEKHFEEVKKQPYDPAIRFFDYPEVSYEGELDDFDYDREGFWRTGTKEDLGYFSAVGYYFAKEIRENQNVPVGIVGCNWGGINAASMMDPEYLRGTDGEFWVIDYEKQIEGLDFEKYRDEFIHNPMNDRTKQYPNEGLDHMLRVGLSKEEQEAFNEQMTAGGMSTEGPVIGPYYERRPGGLYETMLKKIVPFAMRGVIWYQGESDSDAGEAYRSVFSLLIKNWRDLWQEEFPFLFVQLAPFYRWLMCDGLGYPKVRQSQYEVSKSVEGTWMASIGDAGMEWDIHPKDKKVVGERLALLARGHVYGEDILCDAPEMKSVQRKGMDLVISFTNVRGLKIEGDSLNAMQGFDNEGNCVELKKAQIVSGVQTAESAPIAEGERTVDIEPENVLILKDCEKIRKLVFAGTDYYVENLYNEAGIPALPFSWEE